MKFIISILISISSIAQAATSNSSCISLSEARKITHNYLSQYLNQPINNIEDLHSFDLNLDDQDSYLSKQKLKNILTSMRFKSLPNEYQSEPFVEGACAPGADCWAYVAIQCDGAIWINVDGAD